MPTHACPSSYLALPPPCGRRHKRSGCAVEICKHANKIKEAIHLVRLGARAGLVCQLTGLEKTPVNRLYHQIHGVPSPPGQMPFSDAWYREHDLRMLHANLVWRLHRNFMATGRSDARILIDVFEAYIRLVSQPLLDVTRAAFAPRLVAMGTWHERPCEYCGKSYLAPVDTHDSDCPGCRIYHRYRCRQCGSQLVPQRRGRRRKLCASCTQPRAGGARH